MAVTHVLRDGTVLNDITGHIVKKADVRSVYDLIESINQRIVVKQERKRGSDEKKKSTKN